MYLSRLRSRALMMSSAGRKLPAAAPVYAYRITVQTDDYRPKDILWRQPDEANVAYLDFSGALAAARRLLAAEVSKSLGNGRADTGAEERAKLAETTEFEDNTTCDAMSFGFLTWTGFSVSIYRLRCE